MKDLNEINKEIKRIKNAEQVRAWRLANPEKWKKISDKWNKKNRNEYQRAYRAKKSKLDD